MLDVKNLTIAYGLRSVVRDLNFTLEEGQVLGLVGESGSGKSTIIKAILGALPQSGSIPRGEILYQGVPLRSHKDQRPEPVLKQEITMVFQDARASLNPIRTLGSQMIEYFQSQRKLSPKEARDLSIEALKKVNLKDPEELLDQYPSSLSGGMAQRVGVALALALKPRLVLADEPTSALDVTNQAQVVFEMKRLKEEEGLSMILVTHNLAVAAYLADQLLVLEKGVTVDYGPTDQVLKRPKSAYTKTLIEKLPRLGGDLCQSSY